LDEIEAMSGFGLKVFISFSPGFSPVLKRDRKMVNRFNGLPGAQLQRVESEVVPGYRNRKTVETVTQLSGPLAPG